MKKIILAALSILSANCINAQEPLQLKPSKTEYTKNREENIEARAQRDVNALDKELSLTDDQKKKAHDFSVIKINKMRETRAKHSNTENTNESQRKSELYAVMDEYKANIKSILTPSQLEKFSAMEAQNSERK